MRLKYLFFFLTGIIVFSVCAQDKPDKKTDKGGLNAKILFRVGKGDLDPDFMSNRMTLDSFIYKLSVILADTNYVVDELKIVGAASPEGSEKRNIELGQQRAEAMKQYICSKVNMSSSLIKTENKGENWEALRAMVAASDMPYRDEVLDILDNTPDRNKRTGRLIILHNPVPYNYMYKNFFPVLRSGMGGTSGKETVSAESMNNWVLLRRVISLSDIADKEELLKIIDSTRDPHECFEKLKAYKNGAAYNQLKSIILARNLNSPDSLSVKNWDILKRVISSSDMQYKGEFLSVVDKDSINRLSEEQLKDLHSGVAYQYVKDHFFQSLLNQFPTSGADAMSDVSRQSYQNMILDNWKNLRSMIEASDMPNKKEVLKIIDRNPDRVKRIQELMSFDNGNAYKYICDVYLPVLLYGQSSASRDNWQQIEEMVASSDMEDKEEILRIIRTVPVSMGREEKLKAIRGGEAFRQIQDKLFFNYLLNPDQSAQGGTGLSLSYKLTPAAKARLEMQQKLAELRKEITARAAKVVLPPTIIIIREYTPVVGVKSNLLYWAGITSEIKHRNMIPNIELEYYTQGHISYNADFTYNYKNKNNPENKIWGVSSVGIEPRYWFCKDKTFTGLYGGLYGLYGKFDYKPEGTGSQGHTGDISEGGISAGYYLKVSPYLGIEVGGRIGYRSVTGDLYQYADNDYYKTDVFTSKGLKLTGIRLLVTYRFNKVKTHKKIISNEKLSDK
jgi:hypothetical protein